MQGTTSIGLQRHPDFQLWLAAFAFAVFTSFVLVALLTFAILRIDWSLTVESVPQAEQESVATLYLEPFREQTQESVASDPQKKPFARTSPDQAESTERTNERIGERSTQVTSERAADPNAEALPSQFGIEQRDDEIETTESQYQDGELDAVDSPPALDGGQSLPSSPPASTQDLAEAKRQPLTQPDAQTNPNESESRSELPPVETTDTTEPTVSEERSLPPLRETLLEGPQPVDVNVPREEGDSTRPRETPERPAQRPATDVQPPAEAVTQSPPSTPANPTNEKQFKGFQRKTAMVGSISRTGRSALNVDDTELGRYQAAISKAVELEWQRNCVRHRDFITPGFLTVRFFVEPSGRVRSVNFVGEMETGEVQKGFTLSSIREADIPQMPKDLAKVYEEDTLELVFRFYF